MLPGHPCSELFETMSKSIALCLLLLGAAACGPASGAVTLGSAGPWNETYGLMNKRGMELALSELNAMPAYRDQPISIQFRNDSGNGGRAAVIAQEFVDDPAILAVVGHVNSGAMVSAAKVYDGHMAAVATTASSPDLTGISPWVFRVISSDSANGIEIARWAARRGVTSAAILYENNAYGRGLADAFRTAFRGEVLSIDPIAEGGDQDFEPHIAYYKARKPGLVFVAGTEGSGLGFIREARRQRLDALFVGGDGWTSLSVDTVASEGVYVGAPFSPLDPRPAARDFVKAFQTRFGMMPDGNAALGYDATMLLAQAVREAGRDRARIQQYLRGLGGKREFDGVTGAISFTEGGDPKDKQIVVARISGGALAVEAQ